MFCLFALKLFEKVNRKVQEETQAEAAANPRHHEEEKNGTDERVHS